MITESAQLSAARDAMLRARYGEPIDTYTWERVVDRCLQALHSAGFKIVEDREEPDPVASATAQIQVWFHGTDADLSPGDLLVPGQEIGKSNWDDMDVSWAVWITPNPSLAKKYGANVYEVEPVGDLTDWCDNNGWDRDDTNDEWVCDKAKVVRRANCNCGERMM